VLRALKASGLDLTAVRRLLAGAPAMYSARAQPSTAGGRMPHIIAEYSANLEDRLNVQALVDALHQAAIDSGVAELAGIRTRAARRTHFRVADGKPENGFVHIVARLRVGRPEEKRKALGEALLAAADKQLADVYPTHPLGLTVEIHEIDHMTFRRNTLRERAATAA
jgi:5-carboxymethyl-2-hydroxymuconate isomerase